MTATATAPESVPAAADVDRAPHAFPPAMDPLQHRPFRLYSRDLSWFDRFPSYRDGGPATVVVDGWSTSYTSCSRALSSPSVAAADDGMVTLNASRTVVDDDGKPVEPYESVKHPLDGTKYPTHRDAERAAFDAGLIAHMVYDRDRAKHGLPSARVQVPADVARAAGVALPEMFGGWVADVIVSRWDDFDGIAGTQHLYALADGDVVRLVPARACTHV